MGGNNFGGCVDVCKIYVSFVLEIYFSKIVFFGFDIIGKLWYGCCFIIVVKLVIVCFVVVRIIKFLIWVMIWFVGMLGIGIFLLLLR